eukprot:11825745-Karenia_brevis.AAC.1
MTADERIDSSLDELSKAAKTQVEHPPGSAEFLRDASSDSAGSYAAAAAKGSSSSNALQTKAKSPGGAPFKPLAKPLAKAGIRGQSSRSPGIGYQAQGSRPNREESRGANP